MTPEVLAPIALLPYYPRMLAKLTSKNQLTLPQRAIEALGNPSHFQVEVDGDRLVLTPERPGAAAAARKKLAELGISDRDITDAIAWARHEG